MEEEKVPEKNCERSFAIKKGNKKVKLCKKKIIKKKMCYCLFVI